MLYYENEEYKLMPFLAMYTKNGEEIKWHVATKGELESFEEMGHIEGLAFAEADYAPDLVLRLEEVKNYPQSEFSIVSKYVFENQTVEGTTLAIKKQNEILERSILELAMAQMGVY